MHPVVKQILALQQVDEKVARIQKKIDAIPRETEQRSSEIARLEAERDRVAKAIEIAEGENSALEIKVQGIATAVKRQEDHRNKAQNPSTFEAAQHQISYLKLDMDQMQNKQLGLLESIESLSPELEKLREQVAERTAEFGAYKKEAARLHEELVVERDKIAVEREHHVNEIPDHQLAMYRELFETRQGQAVVPLEGEFCRGCYTKITINDQARLAGGSSMVTCKSCGRILYLPQ